MHWLNTLNVQASDWLSCYSDVNSFCLLKAEIRIHHDPIKPLWKSVEDFSDLLTARAHLSSSACASFQPP